MRHVIWLETASHDLDEILGHIEDRNLLAALNLQTEIEHAVSQLPQHPYLYRLGRVPGTREMVVHPNYIVVYRIARSAVEILNVLHSRHQYP
jgi:addiction module RelE/StbE family toxin